MKLFECPSNVRIRVVEDPDLPPGCAGINQGDVVKFHHRDGMYSFCTTDGGAVVHLSVMTEVEVLSD